MTNLATICIPSNRPLIESVEPLWSAINYAEATGMKVVISDNSGDVEKREYFAAAPEHVRYISDGPENAAENVLSTLACADTEFVLVLGDDDFISRTEGAIPFDFASLPTDVVGVKPRIELWSKDLGIYNLDDFAVDADNAAARVVEYYRSAKQANTTYYSFFRRREFTDIYRLFVEQHPMSAGYSDWAIVYALVASGKVVHDPLTTIRYDNSRWENSENAIKALENLYEVAGLPPEARIYGLLFHYLDSYVLILRENSSLPLLERYKAAFAVTMVFLNRLLFRAAETPSNFTPESDLVARLKAEVEGEDPDLDKIFHIAGLIADRIKPGLKADYDRYLVTAARGSNSQ
jgi:hypothetical protein